MSFHVKMVNVREDVRLSYLEQGDPSGIPVVFLHGFTDSWYSFLPVLPHLPRSIRAFAVTQRGHGSADRPESGYRTRDFAEDIAGFVRALGLGPVVLVGHSMGTTNALRFAIDHPELTRALVLAGTFASYRNNAVIMEFREAVARLEDPVPEDFAREFQLGTLHRPVPEDFFEAVVRESLKVPARVWRDAYAGFLEDDFSSELALVTAPTLLIWGDQDGFVSRHDQYALVREIAESRLRVYEHVGHAVHWEEPQRFARDILKFIHAEAGLTSTAA